MDDPERAIAASWLKSDIQFAQIPGQVTVTNCQNRYRHHSRTPTIPELPGWIRYGMVACTGSPPDPGHPPTRRIGSIKAILPEIHSYWEARKLIFTLGGLRNLTGFECRKLDSAVLLYFRPIPACRRKDTMPPRSTQPIV